MYDRDIMLSPEQKKLIGQKIKQRRLEKNCTLEALAQQVHMPVEALERMENGDFELFDDISEMFLDEFNSDASDDSHTTKH